jgi:hypothetical protein
MKLHYSTFSIITALWRLELLQNDVIDVTPHPIFARLKRTHDWVLRGVEMFSGVFIFGGVTASHVSAGETKT